MVAQSSAGMSKMDILRYKLKQAACKEKHSELGKCAKCGTKVKMSEIEKHTCGRMKLASVYPSRVANAKGDLDEFERTANRYMDSYSPGAKRSHKRYLADRRKYESTGQDEKLIELANLAPDDWEKRYPTKQAMVLPPTSALKARLIEAGVGAGLGAMTGAAYEAGRQRFSHTPPTSPSPEEIDLEKRHRAAQIKVKESPTLINRIAATKAMAQLDAERDMRTNPNKAIVRRALQGAIIGGHAAPLVMAAKQNLSPRIMGR